MSVHGSLKSATHGTRYFSESFTPIRWVEWGGPVVTIQSNFSFESISTAFFVANLFHPFLGSGRKKFPLMNLASFCLKEILCDSPANPACGTCPVPETFL